MVANIHPLPGLIDIRILEGCIAGRKEYQKALYDHFAPKMFGICLRYSSDYHHAEDLLQDGFIKAFNNLHRFRGEGSFEGWLKRIFINTAIEAFRKKVYFQDINNIDASKEKWQNLTPLDHLAQQDILKVVQQLPPGYRTVFNLFVVEGYTHKEIGKMLGISEGTSKSQLARARQTLKQLLPKT